MVIYTFSTKFGFGQLFLDQVGQRLVSGQRDETDPFWFSRTEWNFASDWGMATFLFCVWFEG